MSRLSLAFGALILAQAAHSVEEYAGRLYDSFPPARWLTGLVASDRRVGFIILNTTLVGFGLWCFLWPVRGGWSSRGGIVAFWVVLELVNGLGHPFWSWRQGGYTPGVGTAPVLLALALWVAWEQSRLSR